MEKYDYHDFVIKNGKFVGNFEEMYQKCKDPWHQTETIDCSFSKITSIQFIKNFNINSIVEYGCGLGYFSNMINTSMENNEKKWGGVLGVDISETAIKKAQILWKKQNLDFKVDNVLNIEKYCNYDAFLFSEIMWYILDYMDEIFDKLLYAHRGKFLIVNQVFYKKDQQYGLEYFRSFDDFLEYTPFKLLGKMEATMTDVNAIETSSIFEIEKG